MPGTTSNGTPAARSRAPPRRRGRRGTGRHPSTAPPPACSKPVLHQQVVDELLRDGTAGSLATSCARRGPARDRAPRCRRACRRTTTSAAWSSRAGGMSAARDRPALRQRGAPCRPTRLGGQIVDAGSPVEALGRCACFVERAAFSGESLGYLADADRQRVLHAVEPCGVRGPARPLVATGTVTALISVNSGSVKEQWSMSSAEFTQTPQLLHRRRRERSPPCLVGLSGAWTRRKPM